MKCEFLPQLFSFVGTPRVPKWESKNGGSEAGQGTLPCYMQYSTSWAGLDGTPHGSAAPKRRLGALRMTGTAGTPVDEPPDTNAGDATDKLNQALGHLRHPGSRGKGPGASGPGRNSGRATWRPGRRRAGKAQHGSPQRACITPRSRAPAGTPSLPACGRPRNKPKAAAASPAARGPGPYCCAQGRAWISRSTSFSEEVVHRRPDAGDTSRQR